jgi:hypothetical protein
MLHLKRRAVVAATAVALLAGAGGAYAARGSTASPKPRHFTAARNAFLDDVAKRLHTTRDQLLTALKGAASDQVDAAVSAGRLTKAQGDAVKRRIQQGDGPLLGAPFLAGKILRGPGLRLGLAPGIGFGFGLGPAVGMDAVAKYLGLTAAQLRDKIRAGESLAQIAKDRGKSVAGLEQAIRDAATAQLDQAVKDKRITAVQRTEILNRLSRSLDKLVNMAPPALPRRPTFVQP